MSTIHRARHGLAAASLLTLGLVTGCAVTDVNHGEALDSEARWAQLPVANYAETPLAGKRAGAILTTLLHGQGIGSLGRAPRGDDAGGMPDLDDDKAYQAALEWARSEGYRYGVTGAVEEWQYKTGLDGEPAVGITLQVVDVNTGDTLWSASGARSGWGSGTTSGTAQKLMADLLDDLPVGE